MRASQYAHAVRLDSAILFILSGTVRLINIQITQCRVGMLRSALRRRNERAVKTSTVLYGPILLRISSKIL